MRNFRGEDDWPRGGNARRPWRIVAPALGVSLVLAVVAMPVLQLPTIDIWTQVTPTSPFYAPVGAKADDPIVVTLAMALLFRPGPTNETRIDTTTPVTVTRETGGVLALDLTDGDVNPGMILDELSGFCCFSESMVAPDGQTLNFTGTSPQGWLTHIEISPTQVVTTTRIDPTSGSDYTGDVEVTRRGLVTLTSSTDNNQTVVYGNTMTDTHDWELLLERDSDDVFQNRHPGLTVNAATGEGYLLYTLGTDANLVKFDTATGATVWELFDIVDLAMPPDLVFNYNQVVEDDGNVALRVPRANDTVFAFIDDAGGSGTPVDVHYYIMAGSPPGDHQALWLDNRIVTSVHPAPVGIGTEILHVSFPPDPTLPPNVMTLEESTVSGAWHATLPGYAVWLTETHNPGSAAVFDLKPNKLFVVQGDSDADLVRYGTVEVPITFDGFESDSVMFWSGSQR